MVYKSNLNEKLLGHFKVGKGNDIVKVKELSNGKLVESYDFRRYYKADDGEYKPTKSGLRLNYEELSQLFEIILANCDDDLLMQVDDIVKAAIEKPSSKKEKKDANKAIEDLEDFDVDLDVDLDMDGIDWNIQ